MARAYKSDNSRLDLVSFRNVPRNSIRTSPLIMFRVKIRIVVMAGIPSIYNPEWWLPAGKDFLIEAQL